MMVRRAQIFIPYQPVRMHVAGLRRSTAPASILTRKKHLDYRQANFFICDKQPSLFGIFLYSGIFLYPASFFIGPLPKGTKKKKIFFFFFSDRPPPPPLGGGAARPPPLAHHSCRRGARQALFCQSC
ncbi:hypothetical protein ABFS83_07G108100 [Erythranthe nasuta]